MKITLVITILAAVTALIAAAGVFTSRSMLTRHAINASWLGLVACFFGIYFEVFFGAGAALAAAAFGALAASPVDIKDPRARGGAHGVGASIAVSLGVGAVMIAANTFYKPTRADSNVILLAGQWVAMASALASMAGAAVVAGWGKDHRFSPGGLGLLVATMAVGALLQATLRADIPLGEYVVPLSSEGAHVRWALPGITGGAKGFGFEVTQVVAGAKALAIITAVLAIAAGVLGRVRDLKTASWAWLATAASSVVTLAVVLKSGFSPKLPEATAYYEHARTLAVARGIPDRVLSMGAFDNGDRIYVLWLDILPDCLLFGGAALLSLLLFKLTSASSRWSGEDLAMNVDEDAPAIRVAPDSKEIVALWARDLAVRGGALAMLAWVLSMLFSWRSDAVYGFGAPAEWVILGAGLASVGAAIAAWRERGLVQSTIYGIGASAILFAAVTATL